MKDFAQDLFKKLEIKRRYGVVLNVDANEVKFLDSGEKAISDVDLSKKGLSTGDVFFISSTKDMNKDFSTIRGFQSPIGYFVTIEPTSKSIKLSSDTETLSKLIVEVHNGFGQELSQPTVKEVLDDSSNASVHEAFYYENTFAVSSYLTIEDSVELFEFIKDKYGSSYEPYILTNKMFIEENLSANMYTYEDSEKKLADPNISSSNNTLSVPDFIGDFYVHDSLKPLVKLSYGLLEQKINVPIALYGKPGTGKTSFGKALSELLDANLFFLQASSLEGLDPNDYFLTTKGFKKDEFGNDVINYEPTELGRFVLGLGYEEDEKDYNVLIFDEFNRIPPAFLNVFFGMLDHTKTVTIHGERYIVPKPTVFLFTANTGLSMVGTYEMDEALMNRFYVGFSQNLNIEEQVFVLKKKFPHVQESLINSVINYVSRINDAFKDQHVEKELTVRDCENILVAVHGGLTIKEAFTYRVFNGIRDEITPRLSSAINEVFQYGA